MHIKKILLISFWKQFSNLMSHFILAEKKLLLAVNNKDAATGLYYLLFVRKVV